MELFLWLWLYDDRWFWNIKVPRFYYLWLWLFPIFSNLLLLFTFIIHFAQTSENECERSYIFDSFTKAFLSCILIVTIIIFYFNIKEVIEEDKSEDSNLHRIYPALKANSAESRICKYLSRKCLLGTKGIILLLLSIISLYSSYLCIELTRKKNETIQRNCYNSLENYFIRHSYFTIIGNSPIIIILLSTVLIKLTAILMNLTCPNFRIKLVKKDEIISKKIIKIN